MFVTHANAALIRTYFVSLTRIACVADKWVVAHGRQLVVLDPFYVRLGEIIQARRKVLGMKQKNLAVAVEISRGSLANVETGRQSVLVHQLYKFAKALDLQPHELLPPPMDRERSPELNKLMPSDLNQKLKDQLAGLITDASTAIEKEGDNDRSTKK